jgi:hypothetical protein
MKIAIISTYDWIKKENNYGSILQYYALQEYLRKLGHKAYWIRFNPIKTTMKNTDKYTVIFNFRKIISRLIRCLKYRNNKYFTQLRNTCSNNFDVFMKKYLNLSSYEYVSWKEILENPPDADVYITGSDQVWLGLNKANYLEFVPAGKKKYSYGASFGKIDFTREDYTAISPMLKKFDKISVREKEGISICQKAGRNDAVQVVDPTLLLPKEHYLDLTKESDSSFNRKEKNPFVFSYFLNINSSSNVHWNSIRLFAKKKSLNLKVVPVQGAEFIFPKKFVFMPPPVEWLKLIEGATYVITNSFHGTLFAVIFEKPFLVILQSGETSVQNCRFLSLLKFLGLESRLVQGDDIDFEKRMSIPINWEKVNQQKGLLVENSKKFICSCQL